MDNSRKFFTATFLIAVLSIPTIANAALLGRLAATEGGTDYQAYYDDETKLTWLADANAAVGSIYDTYNPGTGMMNWHNANAWVADLSINGVTGWRLPDTNPIDGTTADDNDWSYNGSEDLGFNVSAPGTLYAGSTASEMAYMFYNTLGNLGVCNPTLSTTTNCANQSGWGLSNAGPFINIQSSAYWSATEFDPNIGNAWTFHFDDGDQFRSSKYNDFYSAWAVQSGDVSAVPVPAAVWLFGSGLIGLIGIAKRKKI